MSKLKMVHQEPTRLVAQERHTGSEPSEAGTLCGFRVGAEIEAYFPSLATARHYFDWAAMCSPHLVTLEVAQRQCGAVVWAIVEARKGSDGL